MAKKFNVQIDSSEIPAKNYVAEQVAGNASTTTNGRLWIDTAAVKLKVWLGAVKTLVTEDRTITAGTGLTGGGDLSANRTLAVSYGTAAGTAAQGNDGRLADARTPTGTAGGKLNGTYPNPGIVTGGVGATEAGATIIPSGATVGGTAGSAATTAPALRALGYTSGLAVPGDAHLNDINVPDGPVNMNSQKITGLALATNATDATSKAYVDSVVQGLNVKQSVKAKTSVVGSVGNLSGGAPNAVDGITLAVGDRVLVDLASNLSQNGIYVVQTVGTGVNGTWVRAADADTAAKLRSAFVFVEKGALYADTGWVQIGDDVVLNSDAILFYQFSSTGGYSAGSGMSQTGNMFNVVVDNVFTTIDGNAVSLKDLGITGVKLAVGAVDLASNKVTGILPLAKGGTGAGTASGVRTNIGAAGRWWVSGPVLTAGTWQNLTHNLGLTTEIVQCRDATSGEEVILDWKHVDANTIGIRSDIAMAANSFYVGLVG